MRRDLLLGLAAIAIVLVVAVRATIVGSDLRLLFAVSMIAFFGAGLLVRDAGARSVWFRGLLVSSPGLLGTAALIVNDGLSRWPIPLMISVVSFLAATTAVQCRRDWSAHRLRSVTGAAAAAIVIPLVAIFFVPPMVRFASAKQTTRETPPFALRTSSGERIVAEQLRGRVVVLASWATWCLPCRWELPELDRSCRRFRGDDRVAFFAVDRASEHESPARARRFLEKGNLVLPLAFEEQGSDVFRSDALPTLIILDQNGQTRFVHHGYDASEHLDDVVTKTIDGLLTDKLRS